MEIMEMCQCPIGLYLYFYAVEDFSGNRSRSCVSMPYRALSVFLQKLADEESKTYRDVSMPYRALSVFLLNLKTYSIAYVNKCQCPIGLYLYFYGRLLEAA